MKGNDVIIDFFCKTHDHESQRASVWHSFLEQTSLVARANRGILVEDPEGITDRIQRNQRRKMAAVSQVLFYTLLPVHKPG